MEIKNLSEKILRYIIDKLSIEYKDTDYNQDTDVYVFSKVRETIRSIIKLLNLEIEHKDYGFFWLLYLENKDKSKNESLIIPVEKKLTFDVDVRVTKYGTETYAHKMFTYSENDDFNLSMIHSDGEWVYYEGEFIDDDYYDSDSSDSEIVNMKVRPINESISDGKIITESERKKLEFLLKQKEYIEKEIRRITT